jgi:hypothetical protein
MFKSSIIVSLSSNIKNLSLSKDNYFFSQIRSFNLPGVPTTICGLVVLMVDTLTVTGSPPP